MEENQVEEQEDSRNSGDAHSANWQELVPFGAISTSHRKNHPEIILMKQKGFGLAPQKPKAKRRKKAEVIEVNGGRIIRPAGRKDRHSKVCTPRGTRDRRVRLSPITAIQFYDVQDRLGYDRPSKAIDWLMKEAKAAIDALDEPPPPPANNNHHFVSTAENSNYDPGSGETQQIQPENAVWLNEGNFGFFTNNGAGYSDAGGLEYSSSAPLTTTDETFDANSEMAKIQRILTWNYGNNPLPLHFPAGPSVFGQGQIFSQREPLQSSYSRHTNYNPIISTRFPGFDFSNEELSDFITPEDNEMDKIPASGGQQSSTASFLHYEE